jgi:hypothetical protein
MMIRAIPPLVATLAVTLTGFLPMTAFGGSRTDARKIFRRLTGVLISDQDPRLEEMRKAIDAGRPLDAAKIASSDRNFYRSTLKSMVSPWSDIAGSVLTPLDDLQATAIGLIRDRRDFRKILTGTTLYRGNSSVGLPAYARNNNAHYIELERAQLDLTSVLEEFNPLAASAVGIFQSRGFAKAYYDAGTNRRAVKFAMQYFLCKDITAWRQPSLPDFFVRRDVDRLPSGDHGAYQTECRGCHAPMDALSGAFAYVNFDKAQFDISQTVLSKYNQHPEVFPDGYETVDASWVNYLAMDQQASFGWRGEAQGHGLEEFAAMLANSRAFGVCMVQQAVNAVCRQGEITPKLERLIKALTDDLEANGYDLRRTFEALSINEDC